MEEFIEQVWHAAKPDEKWGHVIADGVTIHTCGKDTTAKFSYAVDGNLFLAAFSDGLDDGKPVISLIEEMLVRHKENIVATECLWQNNYYRSIKTRLPLEVGALIYVDLPRVLVLLKESMGI